MARTSSQGSAISSKVPPNNNPRGTNQYKDCPPPDDPRIPELLNSYHRKGITDRKKISKFLRDEHGIIMSDTTVARRRRELGLKASGKTTADLPDDVKRQLVLDQMAKDAAGKMGTKTVRTRILQETGIHLTRRWIGNEMQMLAPEAYEARKPRRKGSSPAKHQLSENSARNGGSARGEACSSIGSQPPRNEEAFFAEDTGVIHENPPHDLQPDLVEDSPSHIQFLAASGSCTISTQLQDTIADTEAKMIALTRHLRMLSPAISPLDAITSQTLLACMESATLLEREITRVVST